MDCRLAQQCKFICDGNYIDIVKHIRGNYAAQMRVAPLNSKTVRRILIAVRGQRPKPKLVSTVKEFLKEQRKMVLHTLRCPRFDNPIEPKTEKTASKINASSSAASKNKASKKGAPKSTASTNSASKSTAPKNTASKSTASNTTASIGAASNRTASNSAASSSTGSSRTASSSTGSSRTASSNTASSSTGSGSTILSSRVVAHAPAKTPKAVPVSSDDSDDSDATEILPPPEPKMVSVAVQTLPMTVSLGSNYYVSYDTAVQLLRQIGINTSHKKAGTITKFHARTKHEDKDGHILSIGPETSR